MPFVAVNAAGAPREDDPHRLSGCLPGCLTDRLAPGTPVTVMIHGYRYDPADRARDPHRAILSPDPVSGDARLVSWPRRLGFGRGAPGLGVGFGWRATGTIWQAYAEAARAGRQLSALIAGLRARGAGPVGLIGHSLGARVALAALEGLAPGDVGRMVLMAPAEFRGPAQAALATPAGRQAEVLNVTSRANTPFDLAFEAAFAGLRGRALGAADLRLPQAVTLGIDEPDHLRAVAALGYPLAAPVRRVCHWSAYLRPGLFPLYRAFLFRPARLPLSLIARALAPEPSPRRGPRLPPAPLPPGPVAAH